MGKTLFASLLMLLMVMLRTFLPSACGEGQVVTVEGDDGLHLLDRSDHNKMVVVEMLNEGEPTNPVFGYSARMLADADMIFARVDLSHPGNADWVGAAAGCGCTFAAKILSQKTKNSEPHWIVYHDVPQEEEAVVQTFYSSYRRFVMIPNAQKNADSAMPALFRGANKEHDNGDISTSTTTEEQEPEQGSVTVVKGRVEVKKPFSWVARQATMSGGILSLEPIGGSTIFGTDEVFSLENKTVVEGCDSEKDGGCFNIYNKEDSAMKKNKPVAQVRVTDPREAEAWVRHANRQQKKQMSSGQPPSTSGTRASDVTLLEISPTLLIVRESKSSVDCVADVNLADMAQRNLEKVALVDVEGKNSKRVTCVTRPSSGSSGSIGLPQEVMKLLKRKAGDKITWRASDTDNVITKGQEYIQDTLTVFGRSVEPSSAFPRHTVVFSPTMMNRLGLGQGSTVTLRGSTRSRQQEVLVVSGGDKELPHYVGINAKLRKALGVQVGAFATLVQAKVHPTSLPKNGMPQETPAETASKTSVEGSSGTTPSALDCLYPTSAPLVLGDHLSSACSRDNGLSRLSGLGKPVHSRRVCLYPTEKGSVCIARGDEPTPNSKPLWEAGGGEAPRSRWLGGFFGGLLGKSSTSGGDGKDEQGLPVEDVAVCVHHGRLVVGRSGSDASVVDVTYRSPRPRGWWKVYISRISGTGQQIRDAGLKLSAEGRVTMETEDGNIIWEVDLPASGQEDVCLMA